MKIAIVHDTLQKSKGHHGAHLAFKGLPGVDLILVDPNRDDAPKNLAMTGARRRFDSIHDMFHEEQPDIVALCSRLPRDHFSPAMEAMEHGANIFCEKPLTLNLHEADKLAEAAARRNLKIAVAHLARFSLVFQNVKKMLDNGAIGTPLAFYGRGKEDERGGGEDLAVLGTHILDLGCFLFGKPQALTANVWQAGHPLRPGDFLEPTEPLGKVAGDRIFAAWDFPDGVQGVFESRKGLFSKQVRMGITVVGTSGTISVRYDNVRELRLLRSIMPPEDETSYEIVPLREERSIPGAEPLDYTACPMRPQSFFTDANRFAAWDLICAIRENRAPLAGIDDVTSVVEMIYAIYASALQGRRMAFPLVDRTNLLGD